MNYFYLSLYISNLFNYIDRGMMYSLLPILSNELNIPKFQQGLILSCFMIGFCLSSVIFSYLASFYNKVNLLCLGNFILFLSSLGMCWLDSLTFLFFLRCLSGVGEGIFQSLTPCLLNEVYGEEEGNKKISFLFSAINVGSALGLSLGAITIHWKTIYLVLSIGQIVNTLILFSFRFIHRDCYLTSENEYDKIKKVFVNRDWWISILAMTFINFTVSTFASWLPTLYKDYFTPQYPYSRLMAIFSLCFVLASLSGSFLGSKLSNYFLKNIQKLYQLCLCLTIGIALTGYLTLYTSHHLHQTLISLTICLFFFSIVIIPNSLIGIISIPITSRCYSNSFCIFFMHMLGDIPSPIICSWIWAKTNNLLLSLYISLIPLTFTFLLYVGNLCCQKKKSKFHHNELLLN